MRADLDGFGYLLAALILLLPLEPPLISRRITLFHGCGIDTVSGAQAEPLIKVVAQGGAPAAAGISGNIEIDLCRGHSLVIP